MFFSGFVAAAAPFRRGFGKSLIERRMRCWCRVKKKREKTA